MADNYQVRDGTGSLKQFKSKNLSGDLHIVQSVPSDAEGTPYSEDNPLHVTGDFQLTSTSVEVSNDTGNPIPVSGPLTDTQLRATPVPVSGTVAISNSSVEIANDSGNPVPVSGPLTDAQLRASALPVSGPVTDAQLRATPVPVSVSNSALEITNDAGNPVPVSGPVTDAQLRATPLPVSGTVAISNSSVEISNDTGNPVPVSGTVTLGAGADAIGSTKPSGLTAKGYQQLTSLSSAAALTVPSGATVALIQAESQSIRWRDDGSNPTTTVGMVLAAGESVFFTGSLSAFKAIEISASAKLNISYYG